MHLRRDVAFLATSLIIISGLTTSAAAATGAPVLASTIPSILTVADETKAPPYERSRFEHWIDADGDGCNTRYEVLIDESTTPVTRTGTCKITNGTWVSPYDGLTAHTTSQIEIDHVVALAEAWRSGASAWTDDQRRAFANDLDVPYSLTASSTAANQSKADKDPARWLPTNAAYVCEYVTSWALVKYRWNLTVDPAELSALTSNLSGDCGTTLVELPPVQPTAGQSPASMMHFTDVPHTQKFYREIAWLAEVGVSRGWTTAAGPEFRPSASVTRDAMAAFLYRLAGEPAYSPPATSPFRDVPRTRQFYKEISWLATTGISTGWSTPSGKEFRPAEPVSREAMAAFLYRYEHRPGYTPIGDSPFRDVSPSSAFYKEIRWLAASGISTGTSLGNGCYEFQPLSNVTREAMSAFMYRLVNGGTSPLSANACVIPPGSKFVSGSVTAGAFCGKAVAGHYGYTSTGRLMKCMTSSTDSRLRWRTP